MHRESLKNKNKRSHGSVDFHSKKVLGFKKKIYNSVQYINVT